MPAAGKSWLLLFASPGSRTGDGKAANLLLTGPGWKGELPKGMKHISVATRYRVILAMGTEGYFNWMSKAMCGNAPAYAADKPALERFARIGFVPCKHFSLGQFDAQTQAALKDLPQTALKNIGAHRGTSMGKMVDGWSITKGLGVYGTDYMKRAVMASFGWPANLQADAVYPYTLVDNNGETLRHRYTLTFAKGQTPPVNGFWSITMYMIDKGWWFIPNKLNKFTVSPRNNLKANADGSITLYFQKDSPGADKESNWLPAPEGEFIPMLRMYWPADKSPSILDGSWTPPKVQKVM